MTELKIQPKAISMTLRARCLACAFLLASLPVFAQMDLILPAYRIYAGNTHSHTVYTWSHGAQYLTSNEVAKLTQSAVPAGLTNATPAPAKGKRLKPDWQKAQGAPAKHFAMAKTNGFDFYAVTDHSQETAFSPVSATNAAWLTRRREAVEATDARFLALAGYEHSENNGPNGNGHINVYNSAEYLNALAPGVDLPYFYRWVKTATPDGNGPIVCSFNHPGPHQYNDWDYRDPQVTEFITLLEVLNSNNYKESRYQAFINALDKGWKVSPVAGNDNHCFDGIVRQKARTFVLATNCTKFAILEAMKNRRTYASLDQNIQCRYTVNHEPMGSTLNAPAEFRFDIAISDPDIGSPKSRITKLDIVKDGGAVAATYSPPPACEVRWKPVLRDTTNHYFFVRVWNAGGGDAPKAAPAKPVAWLAPVWTGRPFLVASTESSKQ
jgi:hypothetical protein